MIKKQQNYDVNKLLNIDEMIDDLKQMNITFEKMSEEKTKIFLKNNNCYYNIILYVDNFERYFVNGAFVNKFVSLDFAYLKDLSIIDYRLRIILFKMTLDIEHYLKIKIINMIENIENEDGYNIVNMFMEKDFYDIHYPKKVHNSIFKKLGNDDYLKIFSQYDTNMDKKLENIPIWKFLEIITFGELVNFYEFFTEKYNFIEENKDIFILREIVKLRNAVAHNCYILRNLSKNENKNTPSYKIINYLSNCGIGKTTRKNKLSNSRIRQITCLLYMFNEIVTSESIKKNITEELNYLFFNRILLHKNYYNNNELLRSVYDYFKLIITKHYKI